MTKIVVEKIVLNYEQAMRFVRLAERDDVDRLIGPDAAYMARVLADTAPFPDLIAEAKTFAGTEPDWWAEGIASHVSDEGRTHGGTRATCVSEHCVGEA